MKSADPLAHYQAHLRDRKATSYLLWLGFIFGFAGLHRLYNGKIASGILWFITFGMFGLGQFIDLILIPEMAEQRARRVYGRDLSGYQTVPAVVVEPPEPLMIQLLKLAQANHGRLTVTQGVIATGKDFQTIEQQLRVMVRSGYVDVTNDPDSGVVIYEFRELQR
ncbi:MAG: TM2 domain-containing protein [Leptolyngbya sp. SIO4C1]|nr:TM2 domain-containing protein [Leptolyngbya sp. SIO4C1]